MASLQPETQPQQHCPSRCPRCVGVPWQECDNCPGAPLAHHPLVPRRLLVGSVGGDGLRKVGFLGGWFNWIVDELVGRFIKRIFRTAKKCRLGNDVAKESRGAQKSQRPAVPVAVAILTYDRLKENTSSAKTCFLISCSIITTVSIS